MSIVHWESVEPFEVDVGPMRGTWFNLGSAAGSVSVSVGCRRMVVPPGGRTTPVHRHTADAPSPRPDRIVALADVEPDVTLRRRARFAERELGRALGSVRSTLAHMTIAAGYEGFPPHCHSLDDELFVVLEGAGVVVLGDEEIPVRRGTIVDRPPSTKVAHSFRASDTADLVYLVYGDLPPNDICFYPRSGKISFRGVGVIGRIEPLDYWEGEE